MTKRQRFVFSSVLATCLLIGVTVLNTDLSKRYTLIAVLGVVPVALTIWSLWEGWKGVSRLMTIILPVMYSIGAGMFTFLLPNAVSEIGPWALGAQAANIMAWSIKSIFWLLYAIGFYSLLLTENIFTVSAVRTIALARAARVVGFLLTLLTGFFLYNAVWSFRLPYYWNGLIIAGITYLLVLQGLWSSKLEDKWDWHYFGGALVLSLVIGQLSMVFSFWPLSVAVASLVTTTLLYVLLGMYQQELLKRLFKKTLWEYVTVGLVVLVVVTLTTKWR